MIRVEVTEADIRNGEAASCQCCPVAEAMQRATGDDAASVVSIGWQLYLCVWSCYCLAPCGVTQFVHAFDDLPVASGRERFHNDPFDPAIPATLPEELRPFSFDMPDLDDAEWKEQCYGCEQLCDPKKLDEEGYCKECRRKNR